MFLVAAEGIRWLLISAQANAHEKLQRHVRMLPAAPRTCAVGHKGLEFYEVHARIVEKQLQ